MIMKNDRCRSSAVDMGFYYRFLLVVLALVINGCGGASSSDPAKPELTKVTLQLNWVPEAEHGGFYAALVHGYYEQAGLDVEIVAGGVSSPVLQQVVLGRADFGVSNADWIVLGRNDGAQVQAIMAPIQDSPRCILVRPEVNAQSFDDSKDLTLAASPNNPFLAVMQKQLPLTNVQQVPYQSMQPFLANQRYAQQGYSFSEPLLARQQGVDPTVLMVSDLGFNPYTSCLVASESMIQKDPATVRRFVQASIRGWETYLADPAKTNERIDSLNPDQNDETLSFALENIRQLCGWNPETGKAKPSIGRMTAQRFEELGQTLKRIEFLKADVADSVYQKAYTDQFLPEPESE